MPRFVDNVDAIVSKLGTSNVGIVWGLANINWANDVERDDFIDMLTLPRDEV
jgi:hypothetical protein